MKKVLLIDDDPIITTVYQKHFRNEGFEVKVANSGKEGLDALHSFRPDAVLLDLNMPDVSGVKWLDDIRSDPRFAELPVVVFTAATIGWQVWAASNSDVTFMFKDRSVPKEVVEAVKAALGILEDA